MLVILGQTAGNAQHVRLENTRQMRDLGRAKRARRANSRTLLGLALVCLVQLVLAPPPAA
jgi:hypothetical protein